MTYPDPYYGQTPGTSFYGKTGSSMPIDPLSAVAAGGQALSSIFGQQGPTQVDKNLQREGLNKQGAPIAAKLSTMLSTLPLSDRASFLLGQRLTPGVMSGTGFQPHDLFNPTGNAGPTYNAQNQGALAEANKGYEFGQGGFTPEVLQQALANLGSSHDQSYSTAAGGFDPVLTAGQKEQASDAKKKKTTVFGAGPRPFAGTPTSGHAPGGING